MIYFAAICILNEMIKPVAFIIIITKCHMQEFASFSSCEEIKRWPLGNFSKISFKFKLLVTCTSVYHVASYKLISLLSLKLY